MKKVLVAVDFSPIAEAVLLEAGRLARKFDSKLWVLHAAAPEPEFVGYDTGPSSVRDQVAHRLREDHRALQAMAERLREQEIDATALLVQGPTVETILGEAEKLDADLIVLGCHGHHALARAFLGSTSRSVLDQARVPVLVVPAAAAEPEGDGD